MSSQVPPQIQALTPLSPRLKLEWLHLFVLLAECQSFQAAAETLQVRQQTVSQTLKRLEQALGVTLVERDTRFRALTPAGRMLLQKTRQLLMRTQEIELDFRGETRQIQGELNLGSAVSWKDPEVMAGLVSYTRHYPLIKTIIYVQVSYQIEVNLLRGVYSLGFLAHQPQSSELASIRLKRTPCLIVGTSRDADRDWDQLEYIQWLDEGYLSSGVVDLWPTERYPRRICLVAGSLNMALRCCEAGLGALFAPRDMVADSLAAGRLHELARPPFELSLSTYLVWNPAQPVSLETRHFLETLGVSLPQA